MAVVFLAVVFLAAVVRLAVVRLAVAFFAGAVFFAVVFFVPGLPFTPDAFVPADPFKTPAHIKPEWYFLWNYQVLKIFPSELLGILVQTVAMTLIAILPFLDRGKERHPLKRPLFLTITCAGILLWLGLTIWGHYS